MIDGSGPVQSFVRIALPLARPVLATIALFGFMAGWNEYVMAQVSLAGQALRYTAPMALAQMAHDLGTPWGQYTAGALLVSVSVVILFLWLQRYLEAGLTLGGAGVSVYDPPGAGER